MYKKKGRKKPQNPHKNYIYLTFSLDKTRLIKYNIIMRGGEEFGRKLWKRYVSAVGKRAFKN